MLNMNLLTDIDIYIELHDYNIANIKQIEYCKP